MRALEQNSQQPSLIFPPAKASLSISAEELRQLLGCYTVVLLSTTFLNILDRENAVEYAEVIRTSLSNASISEFLPDCLHMKSIFCPGSEYGFISVAD